jgi:hypothetical protein
VLGPVVNTGGIVIEQIVYVHAGLYSALRALLALGKQP